jgi:hypothetical protein
MRHLLQIDANAIISSAQSVRPDDGSAYGWLIAVLITVIAILIYAVVTLYSRNTNLQDQRESTIEKTFNVITASTGVQAQVEQRLSGLESEAKIQTELLRSINNRSHG